MLKATAKPNGTVRLDVPLDTRTIYLRLLQDDDQSVTSFPAEIIAFHTQQEANRIAEAISADARASGHKLVCRYAGA